MKIVSVAQMRDLEGAAFASGITEAALQEQAGAAVAEEVARLLDPGQSVVVLAGHGNNGRDGAVAARRLAERAVPVALLVGPRHALSAPELDELSRCGVAVGSLEDDAALDSALDSASVAVDALVGVGARGALREPLASVARRVNETSAQRGAALRVLAIDIPSGIDADTGAVPGDAVWADYTVTLGAAKRGLLLFPAAARVGRLLPRSLRLPAAALDPLPYELLTLDALPPLVPPRPPDAHKYRFGRVLVVAGSRSFLGAPVLCAAGAARAGAGLVAVASNAYVRQAVAARLPEATYTPTTIEPGDDPARALDELEPALAAHAAIVVGPGLGREPAVQTFVRGLLERRQRLEPPRPALVLDADALYALGGWPGWWERLDPNVILTPHAGELNRLSGEDASLAPWERAGALAARWGCVLAAKGPLTAVAAADGRVSVWPAANPALATAGTGDVLAGICAGLLAQGAAAWDAARLGVGVHALAAAAVVERRGWRSLLASDLLDELPAQLALLAGPRPWRAAPRA